ncbi:trifunctional dihydropteroate synthetase [Tulasnella sp. 403]|nr:trifunctional dihydropteroate synthetase [Tulasnella sp. 403]
MTPTDWVLVNRLSARLPLGSSLWPKPDADTKVQPVLISAAVPHSIKIAGASDALPTSINYGTLCKTIEKVCQSGELYSCMEHLADAICAAAFNAFPNMREIHLSVEKPRALTHAKSVSFATIRTREGRKAGEPDRVEVNDLELSTIIGVNPWERDACQVVRICLALEIPCLSSENTKGFDYRDIVTRVSEARVAFFLAFDNHVLKSSYQTVEALASSITNVILSNSPTKVDRATVRVAKPSALMFAESAEVRISRTLDSVQRFAPEKPNPTSESNVAVALHVAAIALGSNVGDRFRNIEDALQMLERDGNAKVVDTSFLYESKAMYVEEQRDFVNGACLITTTLLPESLLQWLKEVEAEIGRTPTFRWGPRVVDLDLIFYDDVVYDSGTSTSTGQLTEKVPEPRRLVIPHERVHEREFVLRPLADMIPQFIHPKLHLPVSSLLTLVKRSSNPAGPSLKKVVPFMRLSASPEPRVKAEENESPLESEKRQSECRYWVWGEKTRIMAIINCTPDSFSDGGDHDTVESAMEFVKSFAIPVRPKTPSTSAAPSRSGSPGPRTLPFHHVVDIVDIGGCSTRPAAVLVTPEEEIRRTIPVIEAIRSSEDPAIRSSLISIDTFRASVAQAALDAGADVVNDVYGLTGEGEGNEDLLNVVKKAGCPVIMMHSRGDAGQNKDYSDVGGVLNGIREELGAKIRRALNAGVRRWNIIADPGIGFSKDVEGNLAIIRNLREITRSAWVSADGAFSIPYAQETRSLKDCIGSVHPLTSLPVLIGGSRKVFQGKLIDRVATPKDRSSATIATHTAAIQQGADIIRVHDVLEAWDMVKVADALWR